MKLLQRILPHLLIALSLTVGIIIYVDNRNPNMDFLRSAAGNSYVYALCVLAALSGGFQLYRAEKEKRADEALEALKSQDASE